MSNTDPVSSIRPSSSIVGNPFLGSVLRETASVSDSLSVAEGTSAENWTPERPTLTSPDDLPPPSWTMPMSEYRLLAATDESRSLGSKITDTMTLRLQNIKHKLLH